MQMVTRRAQTMTAILFLVFMAAFGFMLYGAIRILVGLVSIAWGLVRIAINLGRLTYRWVRS